MKRQALPNARRLKPQKPRADEVPHVTIEPNTTCNVRCRLCYAVDHPMIKPLADVKAEIDLAARKRRLDAVSLVGGEPTLHPDIADIVRYVKSKGFVCNLLTNGVRFLYDRDLALLDRLIAAGVDRFVLHVDSGQTHVHGEIERARRELFALFEARAVPFSLSVTLYAGEEDTVPQMLRAAAVNRWFDGALITLAMDARHLLDLDPAARATEPDLARVAAAMRDQLHVEPSAYLPSSVDDDEVSWLMYFYWLNARTGATFAVSPELNRALRWQYRATHDHAFFAETLPPSKVARALAAAGPAELLLHPGRARELLGLLRHGRDQLRFHYLMVQAGPRWNAERGQFQICWQCPDATIRKGVLTPVCLSGLVNPLGVGSPTAPPEIRDAVFRHLGEPTPGAAP